MNYVIWKGIKSTDIKGLLISELPTITKPKMRVQETTVDGVDGSIIEELGYETYDKTMLIGLTKGFDIDEVIKYFTGEGQVVFSNEPDKYYNAKIIDQIDYERLLRFRTATVKFRVQPFKYEYEEEGILSSGTIEGAEIKISDVKATKMQIDGRSIQDGEPTPDVPVEIESLGYENLYNENTEPENYYYNANGIKTSHSYKFINQKITDIDESMTVSFKEILGIGASSGNVRFFEFDVNDVFIKRTLINSNKTVNLESNTSYVIVSVDADENNAYFEELLITKGTKVHSYIPYSKYGIEVKTVGKNKLPFEDKTFTLNGVTYTCSNGELKVNGTSTGEVYVYNNFFKTNFTFILPKGSNTMHFNLDSSLTINMPAQIRKKSDDTTLVSINGANSKKGSFTLEEETEVYLGFYVYNQVFNDLTLNLMLEEGDTPTEYQAYQKNTSVIELNAPLRSLPDGTKDIVYIRNNKLYVDRYVGSVVLDGSESWAYDSDHYYFRCSAYSFGDDIPLGNGNQICSHFNTIAGWTNFRDSHDTNGINSIANSGYKICIRNINYTTVDEFKAWLSENNVEIQYELATPVTEEYGDLTILELVEGENNISNSEDANMVIDYIDNKLIINNKGNHTSKPILSIEGTGTIEVSVNDNKFFSYTFPDGESTVVIDSEKQDAYLGNVLKNRNMIGEFPTLESGENIITWTGLVKGIKAVKKSRWL